MGLLVRPAGQTSWMDQLNRSAKQTSWMDQLDRPAGRTSWTDQLEGPAGQTNWTDQLDRPAGRISWTDQFSLFESFASSRIRRLTFQFVHCRSFWVRWRPCFPEPPLVANKKPRSIKDKIIRSRVPTRPKRNNPGMKKFQNCGICLYIYVKEGISVKSRSINYKIDINKNVNC